MSEISIIIPIYNSEKTLRKLIDAIIGQTFSDFELILCDDGSSDRSLEICRKYQTEDQRIRVLSLTHHGVSSARNAGLNSAKGSFIAFADSDDLPEAEWLSYLRSFMNSGGLAVCGYICKNSGGNTVYGTQSMFPANSNRLEIAPKQFIEDIFSNRYMYQGYIWNKLFDRKVIEKASIRFDELVDYNEDRLFLFNYLMCCQTVFYSGIPFYNYSLKKNDGSSYEHRQLSEMQAFIMMCRELKGRGFHRARLYALKDSLRAALLLYGSAKIFNSLDALWLRIYILRYAWLLLFPIGIHAKSLKSLLCGIRAALTDRLAQRVRHVIIQKIKNSKSKFEMTVKQE